jgi:predicted MPP superfamily phosphohydrolase
MFRIGAWSRMNRRTFIKRSLMAAPFALGAGVLGYSRYMERHDVEVVDLEMQMGLPRPLNIAVLGDIHFDPLFETEYLENVIARVNQLSPDLILYTGDLISASTERIDDLMAILSKGKSSHGSYAALGNHEHWVDADKVETELENSGITVLRNRSVSLPGCDDWYLTGLESHWSGWPNMQSIVNTSQLARHIVLAHEPDSFDVLTDSRIALQLSGHSHGGQVRVPFGGAIHLPTWGKKYSIGQYEQGGRWLYVNRGIGTVVHHFRFNCRPEITHLWLT